jgi:hypothetical protein
VRVTHSQVALLKAALDTFSAATGLMINYHKSTFVPICVPADDATALAATLGCVVSSFLEAYLGFPLSDRKLPASALDFLAERISAWIPCWRLGTLDPGSRLMLTSSVLSALPSFVMSVLPIPKGTICRMDRPRRAMFWNESTRCSVGDCLVSWETECRLHSEGGLGLIDLGVQNTCMLLKNVYNLLTGVDNP